MTGFCELGQSENFQVLQTVKCKCAQIAIKPQRRWKSGNGRGQRQLSTVLEYRYTYVYIYICMFTRGVWMYFSLGNPS